MKTNKSKETYTKTYLNKKVHVIINYLAPDEVDCIGVVTKVDELGQLFGTWGTQPARPGKDFIELM